MKFYTEEKKQLPIKDEVDVLVCGAGPAGVWRGDKGCAHGGKNDDY